MASAPPIIGIGTDPVEALNRSQRAAIRRAAQARAEGNMDGYRTAMGEVDRIAVRKLALHAAR